VSYILDALKKSERERRRSFMHGGPTINDNVPERPKKRSLWPYLVVGGLALGVGIFASWAGISYLKKPSLMAKAVTSGQAQVNMKDEVPIASPAVDEEVSAIKEDAEESIRPGFSDSESRKARKNMEKGEKRVLEKGGARKPSGIVQKGPEESDVKPQGKTPGLQKNSLERGDVRTAPSVDSKKAGAEYVAPVPTPENESAVPAPVPNKIYNLGELPPSVMRGLPAFSVSVFLYSDEAATRMVKVNGHMLKEGQNLSEGLRLEEIVPDALIFSYHNYRFRVHLK
jgi:general secretion pathway protein B